MASSSQNPVPVAPLEQTEIEAAPVKPSADTVVPVIDNTDLDSFAVSEPVSEVVSRVLRPLKHSTFTCHAFSHDKKYLATGEMKGAVSIWKTSDYQCVARAPRLLENPVSAITFTYGSVELMAVDKQGSVFRLQIQNESEIDEGNARIESSRINDIANVAQEHGRVEELMHQFSANGDVLTRTWHSHGDAEKETVYTNIEVLSVPPTQPYAHPVFVCVENPLPGIPVLSENGLSILIGFIIDRQSFVGTETGQTSNPSKLEVIPAINFDTKAQNRLDINGERASWGGNGEYLLVWGSHDDPGMLSVYETRKLEIAQSRTPDPMRERSFVPASACWEATMLLRRRSSHIESTQTSILISGIVESKRICFLWDFISDTVTREISMTFCPERTFERPQSSSAWKLKKRKLVHGSEKSDGGEASEISLKDVFPDVCVSDNGQWIASVYWEHQTVAIASTRSGVTVWTSFLAAGVSKQSFLTSSRIKFDPDGRHLLIFGDGAIHAFGPNFLEGTQSCIQMKEHGQLVEVVKKASNSLRLELSELHRCLSSTVLAKMWKAPRTREIRIKRLPNISRRGPRRQKPLEVLDASLSPNGNVLSQIVQHGSDMHVYTRNLITGSDLPAGQFPTFSFPIEIEDGEETSSPENVFLYERQDGRLGLALLARKNPKIAVFCDLENQRLDLVPLETTTCLKICRSSDAKCVYLVDKKAVHKLDLQHRSIDSQYYKSDLSRLIQMSSTSSFLPNHEEKEHEQQSGHCVSDDGRTFLLAWDMKNERSVSITFEMEQSDSEGLIHSADGCLSNCCALSADGNYVAFLDVEDLNCGRLSVKVFSQTGKKQIFHAEIDVINSRGLSPEDQSRVLSNVFCGFSRDSRELNVATTRITSATSAKQQLVRAQTKTFRIQPSTRCAPNYDLQNLKNGKIEKDVVGRMHKLHGVSLFNTPHPDGKTVFQDAFLNGRGVIDQIQELAKNRKEELGLEWNASENEAGDILDHSLRKRLTNDISLAVKIVCSEVAPFRSAAVVMKASFKKLIEENCDIMEDAMRKNPPVREACKLDVHVDFLNPKIRREKVLHINTSDTYLDWSFCGDKDNCSAKWRDTHKEIVADMEKSGNNSTKEASLRFVCIENAAKVGKDGILRPLLLQKVAAHVFEIDVVKWVILFKWQHIWKRRFRVKALVYVLFLICFTLYATLLSTSANLSDESVFRKWLMSCLLGLDWGFGIWMAAEQVCQAWTYVLDGGWKSLLQFVSFKWNILDLASSTMLVIFIPLFHILALHIDSVGKVLSLCVALEALFASIKVWYYAQPFQNCGALVRLINVVANDCLVFLVLASVILFGFSLSLHVLFRHVDTSTPETNSPVGSPHEDDECDAVADRVHEAFGTLLRSLLTLFYALLGDFDQEIYLAAGNLSVPITMIFTVYMLAQMVVLLNLLISIMGDTFDRVQSTQTAQLLIGRAQLIDSCEAGLREATRKKINKSIGRYLYVLVDPEEDDARKQGSDQWLGKIDRIETSCRKSVRETEDRLVRLIEGQMTNSRGVERKVQELSERLDRVEAASKDRNDETMTILNRILERVSQGVAS